MKHIILPIVLLSAAFAACNAHQPDHSAQEPMAMARPAAPTLPPDKLPKSLVVGFYNVENLYDTQDDPKTNDAEFLPNGKYHWTQENYQLKLRQLAKVLGQLGSEQGADVFGLVEIENKRVVEDLAKTGSLAKRAYGVAHADSDDERGVDEALVYDTQLLEFVRLKKYKTTLPDASDNTRDVLLVVLKSKANGATINFFVNHFPSRREGSEKSEPNRIAAAKCLRSAVNEVLAADKNANIVIMGDFNDDPSNTSMAQTLGASATAKTAGTLFNTAFAIHKPECCGTLEYDGQWNLFDQLIVSGNMRSPKAKVRYVEGSSQIFQPDWMRVGFGKKAKNPKRFIFRDEVQPDGFSDHFPVYLKLAL